MLFRSGSASKFPHIQGGFRESFTVDERQALKVAKALPFTTAAFAEPLSVALHALTRAGSVFGKSVLVTGAGPIGAMVVLICSAMGASKIFVSEPNANRRALIESLGVATAVLDPRATDVVAYVKDQTEEGVGVDSAIECSGIEAAFNTCVAAVRNHGVVTQTGLHVKKALVDPALWALKDITIEATWCYPVTMWPRVAGLIGSGKLPVEKLITGRIEPQDVVEKGFKVLLNPSGRDMKVMVQMH